MKRFSPYFQQISSEQENMGKQKNQRKKTETNQRVDSQVATAEMRKGVKLRQKQKQLM